MKIFALMAVAVFCGTGFAQEDGQAPRVKLSIDFKNAKLDEVIAYFQEYSGLNFYLDPAARANDARVTLRLKNVSLTTALKLVLKPRDLGCVHRDGVIVIAPKVNQAVTRIYETRDVMHALKDFAGPRMELTVPGWRAPVFCWFFPIEEPKVADVLVDLVKANTGRGSWDDCSISQANGLLIVTQSKPVHEEIQALLDQLRHYK